MRERTPGNFDAKIEGLTNRAIPFIKKVGGPKKEMETSPVVQFG
jgi:hypothetical protein